MNFTIPAFPEIGILLTALCIGLGVWTFLASDNKSKTVIFSASNITSGIWIVTNTVLLPLRYGDLDLLVKISFASAYLTLLLIWLYIFGFEIGRKFQNPKVINFILWTIGIPLILISVLTSLNISSVDYKGDSLILGYGDLYFVGVAYFISLFIAIALLINRKLKAAKGIYKLQLRFFTVGFILTVVISLGTNLVMPFISNDANSSRIGPFGIVFFLASTAYAILRHRMFDIRTVLGKVTFYGLLSFFAYIFFYLTLEFNNRLLGGPYTAAGYSVGLVVAYLFVFLFQRVTTYLRTQVNSRLINPGYDPLETVDQFSRELGLVVDLKEIISELSETVNRTIRPSSFWLYLFETSEYKGGLYNTPDFAALPKLMQLIETIWGNVGKHPLILDELRSEIEPGGLFINAKSLVEELEALMITLELKVILSLEGSDGNIGIYAFGLKEADVPYNAQDIDFITSLANTASLAINRALLYSEVQDFAASLQRKVDEATIELKETNSKLASTLIEVQDARRKEQDMVDIMGHELRTPMSIVRNAVKMMLFEIKKPEEVNRPFFTKYLEMAFESAKREITLIETLLSATKLDASRVQLHFIKVDGKDIVHDSLEGQRAILSERNMQVEYHEPKGNFDVFADRTRIQEVMDNFLSNAVKYTPKGTVKISLWRDPDFIWISIIDQGIGIGADDLQNLGKKFFRAKQYVRGEGKDQIIRPGGTGLGLYVAFELIRIIGGMLYINSTVGIGTSFTFSIPAYKGEPDKQIDQTFDSPEESNLREHIIIGGNPPTPPAGQELEDKPHMFPSPEDIAAHMATMEARP